MGRPLTYSAEIAAEICTRMAAGQTLREICRDEAMPGESTVRGWAVADVEGFAAQYARAREALCEHWADEIVDIADDGSNDWMERRRKDGSTEVVVDREYIARSELRAKTRQWLLSKLRPGRYGDKVQHTGASGEGPVRLEVVTGIDESPEGQHGLHPQAPATSDPQAT